MSKSIVPLNNLKDIGIKLLDFEEIKNGTKKYTLLEAGNIGYVEKMKSKKNNNFYAIKKIDKKSPLFNIKDFQKETEKIVNSKQNNIIKFYGYFEDKENLNKYKEIYNGQMNKNDLNKLKEDIPVYCLVMDFPKNGSLRDFYKNKIKNRDKNLVSIEENTIINILKKIISGINHLHDQGIMNVDISLDNIFIDESNDIKITDFGISAINKGSKTPNTKKDEQLSSTKACDTYSLGATIIYVMSYKNTISNQKIKEDVKNMHQKYMTYLRKLIERMVYDDATLRPILSDVYDELEVIETFKEKQNNKMIKDSLDEINSEFENKKKEKNENKIKNFQKMKTDMDIRVKNEIKTENKTQNISGIKPLKENEYISTNNIYSNSKKTPNLNQTQSNMAPTPQYRANYPLNKSVISNNNSGINNYFSKTQDNFYKNNSTQLSQAMPAPPAAAPSPSPSPALGLFEFESKKKEKKRSNPISKGLNKLAEFLLNRK